MTLPKTLLSELDFAPDEEISEFGRWGKGDPNLDRRLFRRDDRIYKIWGSRFVLGRLVRRGQELEAWSGDRACTSVVGWQSGFFDADNAPFVRSFIYDETGLCRGYVMDAARPVDRLPNDFIRDAFARSVKSGLVHSDLCAKNVMRRGHRLGYIDLDTVFVDLRRFDVEFERANGALRPHVHPLYRSLVEGFLRSWKPID